MLEGIFYYGNNNWLIGLVFLTELLYTILANKNSITDLCQGTLMNKCNANSIIQYSSTDIGIMEVRDFLP